MSFSFDYFEVAYSSSDCSTEFRPQVVLQDLERFIRLFQVYFLRLGLFAKGSSTRVELQPEKVKPLSVVLHHLSLNPAPTVRRFKKLINILELRPTSVPRPNNNSEVHVQIAQIRTVFTLETPRVRSLNFKPSAQFVDEKDLQQKNSHHKGCRQCGTSCNQKCGDCAAVRYCSKKCQKKNWPLHREHCGIAAEALLYWTPFLRNGECAQCAERIQAKSFLCTHCQCEVYCSKKCSVAHKKTHKQFCEFVKNCKQYTRQTLQ